MGAQVHCPACRRYGPFIHGNNYQQEEAAAIRAWNEALTAAPPLQPSAPTSDAQLRELRLGLGQIAAEVASDPTKVKCCRVIDGILASLRAPLPAAPAGWREAMQRALDALVAMHMEAWARNCGLKCCDDSIVELRALLDLAADDAERALRASCDLPPVSMPSAASTQQDAPKGDA
jgi:hypothetical protein